MSDSYEACDYCGWNGKIRKDGTMRAHRPAKDSGRTGSSGSFPQEPTGPLCPGSGKPPYEPPPMADSSEPTAEDYAKASRIIQSLIPRGRSVA